MITADQLVAHAVGDYLLQSDWMATEKVKRSIAALAHVATYGLPFLLFRPTLAAYLFIVGTHFVIDRWRLARYVCWAKNFLGPMRVDSASAVGFPRSKEHHGLVRTSGRTGAYHHAFYSVNKPWKECASTGYPDDRPPFLTVWLLIIADNVMHVLCNAAALKWL